jgi:hypothetical protein
MPTEAYYLIIAAVLAAVLFAIWKGRGLTLSKDKDGIKIAVKEGTMPPPPARQQISVASGAKIEGSTTGDIAGFKVRGGGAAAPAGTDISVLDRGRVKDSAVGDIAAVKQEDGAKPEG